MTVVPPFYVSRPETPAMRGTRTMWLAGFGHAIRSGSADGNPYRMSYARRTWQDGHDVGAAYLAQHERLPGLADSAVTA